MCSGWRRVELLASIQPWMRRNGYLRLSFKLSFARLRKRWLCFTALTWLSPAPHNAQCRRRRGLIHGTARAPSRIAQCKTNCRTGHCVVQTRVSAKALPSSTATPDAWFLTKLAEARVSSLDNRRAPHRSSPTPRIYFILDSLLHCLLVV